MPQPGSPSTGGFLCSPDERQLRGSVLLPEALQDEQAATLRRTQGQE